MALLAPDRSFDTHDCTAVASDAEFRTVKTAVLSGFMEWQWAFLSFLRKIHVYGTNEPLKLNIKHNISLKEYKDRNIILTHRSNEFAIKYIANQRI